MKLDKFNKLRLKLEVFKLEKNYFTLDKVLYYFSFLGNIFLIYFGYFFIKTVTNSIPPLFPFQDTFFTIFVALFLAGYELTKRFTLEQFFIGVMQVRRLTGQIFLGGMICCFLIAGSFYLSIKGAHRLVDKSEVITATVDLTISQKQDSIIKYYDKEITYYRNQPGNKKEDRTYRDSIVNVLQQTKDAKIQQLEMKTQAKASTALDKNVENSIAFLFITIFLEALILIGVGFNAFYTVGSFEETKKLLQTPKFKQLELNMKLLKLYYQNGKKTTGDLTLSFNKFKMLVEAQGINCLQKDLRSFIITCQELDIVKIYTGKRREFLLTYQQAKDLLENQEVI
jgi:sRNA-binding regulator protein Hfq